MKNDRKKLLSEDIEPVFIVGMNGSGTTMLVDSLGHHPDLYGFPAETRELPYIISNTLNTTDLNNDKKFFETWLKVQNITAFRLRNYGKLVPIPDDWAEYTRDLSTIINSFFLYFSEKEGKSRWCEKTPQHVQHMDLLLQVFPKARFIHIIRDGRDCAASFHRRWKRSPELAMYRWKNVVKKGQQARSMHPDAYFELKYEDITSDPQYWMSKICTFLDVPFHKDVLLSRQPQSENSGALGGIKPNSEKWKTYYTPEQIEKLEEIAGTELVELGYEVLSDKPSTDPAKVSLMWWRMSDNIHMFTREIDKKIKGESKRPWYMLLSLPKIAYKQWRSNKF